MSWEINQKFKFNFVVAEYKLKVGKMRRVTTLKSTVSYHLPLSGVGVKNHHLRLAVRDKTVIFHYPPSISTSL